MSSVDSLLVIAPIRAGAAEELEAYLQGWPTGDQSPLKQLPGTHMARFVVLPPFRRSNGRPLDDTSQLLFGAEFDGHADAYVAAVAALPEARRTFEHCAGYRDDGDTEALRRYLCDYRISPGFSIVAFDDAALDKVLTALELRRHLGDFVIRTQGFDADALKRQWASEFAPGG